MISALSKIWNRGVGKAMPILGLVTLWKSALAGADHETVTAGLYMIAAVICISRWDANRRL